MKWIPFGIVFIFGAGAGWIANGNHMNVFFTSYVPAVATLLAAFYGAKYAFEFQLRKELIDRKKKDLASGNIAIFNLMRMTNALMVFRKQVIDPFRDHPSAFLEIPPTLQAVGEDVTINVSSLFFLLETDDRNLLGEIVIEERRYITAIEAISERSKLHRFEIQPLLERAEINQHGTYSIEYIQQALGERYYCTLQSATNQVIQHVDQTIISLQVVSNRLADCLKKINPADVVISFAMPE